MKLKNLILNILFPPHCCVCDGIVPNGASVCDSCKNTVIHTKNEKGVCACCGIKKDSCVCGIKRYYSKLCFPLFYAENARNTIQKFKFHGRTDLAAPYAGLIDTSLRERGLKGSFDIITFVPMTSKSLRTRGYNQAELIAKELAKQNRVPCIKLLDKIIETESQHTLSGSRRKGNMLGVFEVNEKQAETVNKKRILVIDDILTGGSTMNEAAKTLLIFGAESVYGACIAVTEKKDKKQTKAAKLS